SGLARLLRDGDPKVDPTEEKAPQDLRDRSPRRLARGMKRGDGRPVPQGERCRAEHRREGLVYVQEVDALARERTAELRERARAQDEVRERAVTRDDHRAAEGDHAWGRRPGPSLPRVKHPAEGAGRVVADEETGL